MTTPVQMPARRWAGNEPAEVAAPPVVLVSSRDGHEVPRVAGAVKLAAVAEAAGWSVRQTYALADVPERRYQNGNVAKTAHRLHSVVVRFTRPDDFAGHAAWWRVDEGPWRFDGAQLGMARYGLRELTAALQVPVDEGRAA